MTARVTLAFQTRARTHRKQALTLFAEFRVLRGFFWSMCYFQAAADFRVTALNRRPFWVGQLWEYVKLDSRVLGFPLFVLSSGRGFVEDSCCPCPLPMEMHASDRVGRWEQ